MKAMVQNGYDSADVLQVLNPNETAVAFADHDEVLTMRTIARPLVMEGGLRFRAEFPGGTIVTDMPVSVGGGASAWSPGWLWRASLAACEATLIQMRPASLGVAVERLEVTVDSESDDRGILGRR